MSRESDLLLGLLALQMNFITREQLLECAAVWMGDRKSDLGTLLLKRKYLKPTQQAAVKLMVDEQVKANEGNLARSLAVVSPPRELVVSLLGMKPPADVKGSIVALSPRNPDAAMTIASRGKGGRYRFGAEIARGGLGKVMEAYDVALDRDVAVKLILEDLPPDLAERFEREAKLTGRLDHPNIVPIYDFGTLPGGRTMFLAMKRIRGRDMGRLLGSIAAGDEEARRTCSRPRLLRMFQDVCLGIAFAHDHGVIHRDLKPGNIMIGAYGETLIVDWGLARVMTDPPEKRSGPPLRSRVQPVCGDLTEEGEILGTPAYMPPEQAEGRLAEMDQRSDVYSLGAILYEILTLHPPFEGGTVPEIIDKVRSGRVTPPSSRVSAKETGADRTAVQAPSTHALVEPIPPELEAICLKALAFRREDRYSTAMELHDEIQLFLEGVKERAREHKLAEEAVAKANDAITRNAGLKEEAKSAAEAAKKKDAGDKAALWAAEDRASELGREAAKAFAEATTALAVALNHEKGHAESRRLMATLFWGKYLEAEEKGNTEEMVLQRAAVEQYNDGPLDALLQGNGTLTVRTRAWRCRCLLDGRVVPPEELARSGYHPFSGRAIGGHPGALGLPGLEPEAPVRLRIHGPSCAPEPVPGADVWLWRYEDIGRLLIPVTPPGASGAGRAPVDSVFAPGSPFRPHGPGLHLGSTPIERRPLPMGSYLLILARDGFEPIRCPVTIPRCGHGDQDVTLFRAGEIPEGFIAVPAGGFGFQGDSSNPYGTTTTLTPDVDDFFIARHPVTCREYAEFLNGLARTDPADAARRVPRESQESSLYWPGPPWAVPTAAWLAQAPAALKAGAHRLPNCLADWEADWPVVGVSWEDGMAYAAWKRARQGGLFTLPHEIEWEKAARGTDRRWFPFGRRFDETWCNARSRQPGGSRPCRVGEFPHDESPYGVRGLAGNAQDSCLNDPGPEYPGMRIARGGHWTAPSLYTRTTSRGGGPTKGVFYSYGFRLGAWCRIPRPPSLSPLYI